MLNMLGICGIPNSVMLRCNKNNTKSKRIVFVRAY